MFDRNNLVTNYVGQHVVPFVEANSGNLFQPKLSPSYRLSFIFIWTTLIVSCQANIWSQMRHIFCNYFGCRNIKPGSKSFKIAGSGKSEKEDKKRCIAELDDVKPAPLDFLIPNTVSQYQPMDEQCPISLGVGDHIVDASPANPIIIEDHHIEPSRQE